MPAYLSTPHSQLACSNTILCVTSSAVNYFDLCTLMEAQGYTVNSDGDRIIAASRRPDGTLRKERRVKPGYVPQDEQPVYQPRGAVVRGLLPVVVC